MSEQETKRRAVKDRLSAAAVRLLAGDRTAIKEVDDAMSQAKQLRDEKRAGIDRWPNINKEQ